VNVVFTTIAPRSVPSALGKTPISTRRSPCIARRLALHWNAARFLAPRDVCKRWSNDGYQQRLPTPKLRFPELEASPEIRRIAWTIDEARREKRQLHHPLSDTHPALTQHKAYRIAAEVGKKRRTANPDGEVPIGRKIGFTNRNIWPSYGLDASNWSYVYDKTIEILDCRGGMIDNVNIANLSNLEPKTNRKSFYTFISHRQQT
jgi:hypothetical protein